MIEISHECWNARRKTTTIGYSASSFHGRGVPLQVILHAFRGKEIVWFSLCYGEYRDNTLLVGLSPSVAARQKKIRHDETSPIRSASRTEEFEEYVLTDDVQKGLGIAPEANTYEVPRMQNVQHLIHVHDDCFSAVEPVDQELLKQLVWCVLLQHSYYQGIEIDWSHVLEAITEEVCKSGSLKMTSLKKERCLTIRRTDGAWEFMNEIKELLFPRSFCAVTIGGGKAHFTKPYRRRLGIT